MCGAGFHGTPNGIIHWRQRGGALPALYPVVANAAKLLPGCEPLTQSTCGACGFPSDPVSPAVECGPVGLRPTCRAPQVALGAAALSSFDGRAARETGRKIRRLRSHLYL